MKLDSELLDFVKRALRTAQLFKFDDFVIEQSYVRGWNTGRTALIADTKVPKLPFAGVGFNRVGTLLNRMTMLDDYTLDLEIKNDFVMGLVLKSSAATIKYKCANPNAIKTPKHLNDVAMWTMELSPRDIELLSRAQSAMGAHNAHIKSVDGAVTITLTDADRDSYSQIVAGQVQNIGGINDSLNFERQYDVVTLLTALKHSDKPKDIVGPEGSIRLTIGQGGNMTASVNTISVYICPIAITKEIL